MVEPASSRDITYKGHRGRRGEGTYRHREGHTTDTEGDMGREGGQGDAHTTTKHMKDSTLCYT